MRHSDKERYVYVAQQRMRRDDDGFERPLFDSSAAESFGIRRYVIDDSIRPYQQDLMTEHAFDNLELYDAGRDYLLLVGSPMAIAICFHVACIMALQSDHSHVYVLDWHSRAKRYEVIHVPLENLYPVIAEDSAIDA